MRAKLFRQALLLCLLAFLPAIGQALYLREKVSWQSPVPPSEQVTVDLAREWGESAIWVDARPEEDFTRDHVPGAVLLNEDKWNELLPQFLAQWSLEKKVVVYCSTQDCNLALEVARRLRNEAQLENVFVLNGGWEEWLKRNR